MGLGSRFAGLHDTTAVRKVSMDTSVYHVFKEGQAVMTVDGVPGTVIAVWDGPVPGNEDYEVTLNNGIGGGHYTASQLTAVGPTPNTASEHHLASDDYPEMGSILYDRPPIEREATGGKTNQDEPRDNTSMTDPFAWADDEELFAGPDLSRQLPADNRPTPATSVQQPPYVDPQWEGKTSGIVRSFEHRAAKAAQKCPTCKGKGFNEGWELKPNAEEYGDDDNDAYELKRAPCDDCNGTGTLPAISDDEEAKFRKNYARSVLDRFDKHDQEHASQGMSHSQYDCTPFECTHLYSRTKRERDEAEAMLSE